MKPSRYVALLFSFLLTPVAYAQDATLQNSYTLEAQGKYQEAMNALLAAENKSPEANASFIISRRGWLAYLLGSYGESAKYYKAALERNPKSIEARLGATLPLLAQQRWKEAALYAKQVIGESAWDVSAHLRLMQAEEGLREWRTLEEHARSFTDRYPADVNAWVYLARAQAWQGDNQAAQNTYQRVLDRIPGNLEALQFLGLTAPAAAVPAKK